jgi:LasA protease
MSKRVKRLRRGMLLLGVIGALIACARPTPVQQLEEGDTTSRTGDSAPVAPVATSTTVSTPSPAYPGIYVGTPTPNPTLVGSADTPNVESYVVQPGETLSLIAAVFGCTIEELTAANGLAHADSIQAGQTLYIPVGATETGTAVKLLSDSELVYGPAYVHFDLEGFVAGQGGYLADYGEEVEGRLLTGPEIVQLVSQRFSVGPRVLLTLLEMRSGWVTDPQPATPWPAYPLGYVRAYYEGLFQQLSWAAVQLNEGYYGYKRGDHTTMRVANGIRAAVAPGLNPGTAGVQNCLAGLASSWDEWLALTDSSPPLGGTEGGSFLATYERLFGNPFAYTVEPLTPPDLKQPEMRFPWKSGHTWYFTGGPHGGWGSGSGRAALDFVPGGEILGCAPSSAWVTAAASGLVLRSDNGEVVVDLDGDGFEQSGWTLLYMHVYVEDRVQEGVYVQRGDVIGHPSCEGGFSEATHLHFARRYNGEWIPAGSGPIPMVLSGWTAHEDVMPYEGTMTRGDEERVACECWNDDVNGLVSDNAP